jgi:hypothetical protein
MPLKQQKYRPERRPYKKFQYQFLEQDEHTFIQRPPGSSNLRSKIGPFTAGIVTTLLLTLLYLLSRNSLITRQQYIPDAVPDEEWNHCGRSSKVAMERGCIWSLYSTGGCHPSAFLKSSATSSLFLRTEHGTIIRTSLSQFHQKNYGEANIIPFTQNSSSQSFPTIYGRYNLENGGKC